MFYKICIGLKGGIYHANTIRLLYRKFCAYLSNRIFYVKHGNISPYLIGGNIFNF